MSLLLRVSDFDQEVGGMKYFEGIKDRVIVAVTCKVDLSQKMIDQLDLPGPLKQL
jgi:hypothetical protein